MIRKTISAGGVVLGRDNRVLIVNQYKLSWSLPRGHVEMGEELLETAKREIGEESGITELELTKELGSYERPRLDDPEEIKEIHMFLFKTNQEELKPVDPDNPEAKWVEIDEVENWLTAEKDKEFFRRVKKSLLG